MNLLGLGASGGVGKWVTHLASEAGHKVTAVVRPGTPFEEPHGVRVVRGDVLADGKLARKFSCDNAEDQFTYEDIESFIEPLVKEGGRESVARRWVRSRHDFLPGRIDTLRSGVSDESTQVYFPELTTRSAYRCCTGFRE